MLSPRIKQQQSRERSSVVPDCREGRACDKPGKLQGWPYRGREKEEKGGGQEKKKRKEKRRRP
jgi:hypothetical protein